MSPIDPVTLTRQLEQSYRQYLHSALRTNDPELNAEIQRSLDGLARPLTVGPIIETTPPFKPGRSIRQLVDDGVLANEWVRSSFGGTLPLDRPLYAHQDDAIERATSGRNVIVATGTSSGKTESFLIPIIDDLLRQSAAGVLGPGVRALLLYPMNALANDQLKRLRLLLADLPQITFGRYTGETKQRRRDAESQLRTMGYSSFLPNELLSRDEIQQSAPHILLTNYAMLEYLLMRPADSSIFECGPNGWKFVVLDEVHSYDGALGLEVAMLLRRLFERVGRSGRVRCIGTSATIGEGAADAGKVAAFASSLFSSSFEYDPVDPRRQDIVLATRMEHTLPAPTENLPTDELLSVDDPHKLVEDIRVQSALDRIWQGPVTFTDLSTTFPDCSDPKATTRHVLTCLSSAPYVDDTPLLRARYHTFVRAIPGADICIRTHTSGRMRVFFEPHRWCDECGEGAELLELASCRRCGQWHIRAFVDRATNKLERAADFTDQHANIVYLALVEVPGIDEDESVPESTHQQPMRLCTNCLELVDGGECKCPARDMRQCVLESPSGGKAVRCVSCGTLQSVGGPRKLFLGSDAPPSVLAGTLFDNLPAGPSGDQRKFLVFSDSRQDAAFFAPYLERTYGSISRRRLILAGLRALWAEYDDEALRPEDVAPAIRRLARDRGFFPDSYGAPQQMSEVKAWLMAELTAFDHRQSLGGVGLATRRWARPRQWVAPGPLLSPPWNLTADEAWTLIEMLGLSLLDRQAIVFPDGVSPSQDVFEPRNKEYYVRRDGASASEGIISWCQSPQ